MKWIPDELYQKIIAVLPIVCVDAAITYQGKILLVKRKQEPARGEWWFPGGRLYKNETLEKCALRKAKEECGLICQPGPVIHFDSTIFEKAHTVNFCILLYANTDKVILDNTSSKAHWFNNPPILNSYVAECIKKAKDYAKT